jgi:tetrahydromethanopterin S-methyltransferase subunit G
VKPGWLQLGLDEDEIEHVRKRLEKLLEKIDAGKIATY